MWLPTPQRRHRAGKEAKVQSELSTFTGGDTCVALEATPAVHEAPSTPSSQGMDTWEVVFDSSCMTQHASPSQELWSRFPWLDAPPWLGAHLHRTHCFVVLPVMAGNCGCFTAANTGSAGKVPSSLAFHLSGQADVSK